MAVLCVLLWGFTAILGKLITLPALPLVWWRMLLVVAVLALLPLYGMAHGHPEAVAVLMVGAVFAGDALAHACPQGVVVPRLGQGAPAWPPPQVARDLDAAIVFTSGSTGQPEPQEKHFGGLVDGDEEAVAPAVDREAELVRRAEPDLAAQLLAGDRGRVALAGGQAVQRVEALAAVGKCADTRQHDAVGAIHTFGIARDDDFLRRLEAA